MNFLQKESHYIVARSCTSSDHAFSTKWAPVPNISLDVFLKRTPRLEIPPRDAQVTAKEHIKETDGVFDHSVGMNRGSNLLAGKP